jgi:hypothetical protein
MNTLQDNFIQNEIWTLTFSAAFQRANIYNELATERLKKDFKIKLKNYIENELLTFYARNENIADDIHIKNIQAVSNFTANFSNILNNGRLNFGVSQKLLNLLLKYQWCIYEYPVPPHFPVDRRIQDILNLRPTLAWTRIINSSDYMRIIEEVRTFAGSTPIAQYELEYYERRRNQLD